MPGRWVHLCQAIDFKTLKTQTVVNGVQADDVEAYSEKHNLSQPIGRVESLKDNFIIGLYGENGKWFGKQIC